MISSTGRPDQNRERSFPMNKKEILEKSQKENQFSDERDRQLEQKACTAGYRAVAGVNCLLCLLLILQERLTGKAYTNWWPFMLAVFISKSAHDLTLYRYYRRKYDLILGLITLIPPILTVFMIVKGGF